ncbi:MAG: hypothetical protein CEE38_00755 [Planctomycetes bacterium B3_Pla]|nr:MAG: hypothetical protein CEE38_00755 [Planctomycetes bacterium B3_Pla]
MKVAQNHLIKVLAVGFIVLILLSLPLFWTRLLCEGFIKEIMPSEYKSVRVEPCGLMPPEIENDPNVIRHSHVSAHIIHAEALPAFGIADYFAGKSPKGRPSNIYYLDTGKEGWEWIYFDEGIGQIVCRRTYTERMPDSTSMRKKGQLYAGPEGVSETPDKNLGRFASPVVGISRSYGLSRTLYDKKSRRFFTIDFHEGTVTKGPQLAKDDPRQPIQIGMLRKNHQLLDLYWSPTDVRISGVTMMMMTMEEHRSTGGHIPIRETDPDYRQEQYVLVLDESGRIDLLDRETLAFAGTAGHLPTPESFFPSRQRTTPRDLLAYRVLPLALQTDHKYRGMFVASVGREGTGLALAVFNEKGELIRKNYTRPTTGRRGKQTPSSKAVFFDVPWGPVLTITKYLLENLHPPVLSVVSYFTADSFEAASGHRALFLLPNSFVAMKGRSTFGNSAERFMYALLLILPSFILTIWLAYRLSKNAATVGLPRNTRLYWVIGTIAFGLPAYITYRLTRPRITLVTCSNCGKQRRTDMDKCHRCGSKWDVPELTPPAWRVLDGVE